MITAKVKEGKKVGTEFPKLMKSESSGLIVLFEKHKHGVTVRKNDDWRVGHVSDTWHMDNFEDFTGEITLKNN